MTLTTLIAIPLIGSIVVFLLPVAKAALNAGASWLGVALVEEAHSLRAAGVTAPLLAWLVPPGSNYAAAIDDNIDLAVPSLDIFREIVAVSKI